MDIVVNFAGNKPGSLTVP